MIGNFITSSFSRLVAWMGSKFSRKKVPNVPQSPAEHHDCLEAIANLRGSRRSVRVDSEVISSWEWVWHVITIRAWEYPECERIVSEVFQSSVPVVLYLRPLAQGENPSNYISNADLIFHETAKKWIDISKDRFSPVRFVEYHFNPNIEHKGSPREFLEKAGLTDRERPRFLIYDPAVYEFHPIDEMDFKDIFGREDESP